MIQIHDFLKKEVKDDINQALFWSYMLDESTDMSILEEVIIYACFIDIAESKIMTRFLAISAINGHPESSNIFQSVKRVLTQVEILEHENARSGQNLFVAKFLMGAFPARV